MVKVTRGAFARTRSITFGQDRGGDAFHHRDRDVAGARALQVGNVGAGAVEILQAP